VIPPEVENCLRVLEKPKFAHPLHIKAYNQLQNWKQVKCDKCGGTGILTFHIIDLWCDECEGEGHLWVKRRRGKSKT
jgi:hypothetical protein